MTSRPVSEAHETAERLFERHAAVFGTDLGPYRGHVHRVIELVARQRDVPAGLAGVLGLTAFFHDAGIWFDATWDYLPPSANRAVAELAEADRPHGPLVRAMIDEHHRLRPARHPDPMVEAFRRADLADVSAGLAGAPGVSRAEYRALCAAYPDRGFRPMLLRAFARGLREAPFRPVPMVKL